MTAQLSQDQADQYRERVARIAALRQMADQAAHQANQAGLQAREHRRNADLLESELYGVFLPEMERALGLVTADEHNVVERLLIETKVRRDTVEPS